MQVYSKEHCAKCTIVKNLLSSKNIPYVLIDDYESVLQKAKELNMMEMPIIFINPNEVYSGTEAVKYLKRM